MKNSNQVREFVISDSGISIEEVAIGPLGVLTGSARENYKLEMAADEALREKVLDRINKEITNKKLILDARIADLMSQFESEKEEMNRIFDEEKFKKGVTEKNRQEMMKIRGNKEEKITKKNPK